MADPFVGEIKLFAGNFAPKGWATCDGQLMSIAQNQALFALIGTFYGGDGVSTFALPDLRGRFPMHQGGNVVIGEVQGTEKVSLTLNQIPVHTHTGQCSNTGSRSSPVGGVWATDGSGNIAPYSDAAANATMAVTALGGAGGDIPHENMQPFVVINYIIALFGIFPSRN